MEIAESIGFIHYWGFTPGQNFMPAQDGQVNILITGTGDLRHMLKTLSETCLEDREIQINIYLQESHLEVLARDLLLLLVINDSELPIRERVELFLDIYANSLNRDRTAEYISSRAQQLIKLVTEHRQRPALSELVNLSALKYKERDELEEIFKSWDTSAEFDMESNRDQRLRYHYKDRYDVRTNLVDWDYQWNLKQLAPQVNYRYYREWRQTGVSHEFRLATYTAPNKTLAGYVPGTKKTTRDSVLVRGYWGDIVMSPYWAFGIEVDCCENCNTILNKVANTERVHHSQDIGEYNVTRIITQLETLTSYHFPPEKDKMIRYKKYWAGEEIKEEVVAEVELINDQPSGILPGFTKLRCQIFPVAEGIEQMAKRAKFREMFDLVVAGAASSSSFGTSLSSIVRPEGKIVIETVNNVIILKDEQKEKALEGIRGVASEAQWREVSSNHNFIEFIR